MKTKESFVKEHGANYSHHHQSYMLELAQKLEQQAPAAMLFAAQIEDGQAATHVAQYIKETRELLEQAMEFIKSQTYTK